MIELNQIEKHISEVHFRITAARKRLEQINEELQINP
jgi:hypothetical protein